MPPRPVLALIALALIGHGARAALVEPGAAAGGVEVIASGGRPAASALAHRDSIAALSRPLAHGERINLDRATVPEIARLPRVGVALAKRIAADRAAHGAFGSLDGLDRVAGIGPAMLKALEPHVSFSPAPMGGLLPGPAREPGSQAQPFRNQALTGIAQARDEATFLEWLNRASAGQLDRLPGIGRARAAAIVRYRDEHGPFPGLSALSRVPGINPAQLQRLYDHIQVP
jgi:competence protein ComEA